MGVNIIALAQSVGPVVGCKVSLFSKTGLVVRVLTLVHMFGPMARLDWAQTLNDTLLWFRSLIQV